MKSIRGAVVLVMAAAACGGEDGRTSVMAQGTAMPSVSAEALRELSGRRILFGHQSVGGNVLEGVRELPVDAPLRVVALENGSVADAPGVYHALIGQNGAAKTKLDAFVSLVGSARDVDAALMKFCYVDVNAGTDPDRLFEEYRLRMESLRASRPGLVIVHVTMPLTVDRGTLFHWRTLLRGGKARSDRQLNYVRHRYNERLRAEYGDRAPIFDLARVESTGADGLEVTVSYAGARVPVLAPEWTDDGGHLNTAGRRQAAEALLTTLASF